MIAVNQTNEERKVAVSVVDGGAIINVTQQAVPVQVSTVVDMNYLSPTIINTNLLTDFILGANAPIVPTDNILEAFGKAQAQLNAKEPTITEGVVTQYFRGDKTFQTLNTAVVPETTNLYFTEARSRTAISLTTNSDSGNSTYNNLTGVLNIPNYTTPIATSLISGTVKLFSDTVQTVAATAVSATSSRTYGIQLNSSGQMVVNVPWVDTNIVYTHPTFTAFTPTLTGANVLASLTTNTNGHVTALTTRTLTPADIGAQVAGSYDNYQSWNLRTNGLQRTTIQSGGILDLVAGTNVTISYSVGGVVTINSSDTVYTHPTKTWVDKTTLSGATVISNLTIDALGHPTDWVTRVLTLADLGYTGATNANFYVHPNHSGDVVSVSDGTTTIQPQAVTYSKIQNVTADRLLGRLTTLGVVEELTATQVRTFLNVADGANNYVHPSKDWVDKITLTGATVISNLSINSLGHPIDWSTRNITSSDIGAVPTTRAITINGIGQDLSSDRIWTLTTSDIAESTNLYFNEARVRSTTLTGYIVGANSVLTPTDTVLLAFGKLQSQINNFSGGGLTLNSSIIGYVVGLNTALADTDTILEAFGKAQGQINARVSGSGTVNYLAKFTPDGTTLGDSLIFDNGSRVMIGETTSYGTNHVLQIGGTIGFRKGNSFGIFLGNDAGKDFTFGTVNIRTIAIGGFAMGSTGGDLANYNDCVAIGYNSRKYGGTGLQNVSIGPYTMSSASINTAATNVAIGNSALSVVTSGSGNTVVGRYAGKLITTGGANVAIGLNAGEQLTTGNSNIIIGGYAGDALTTQSNNVIIGNGAGTLYTNNSSVMVGSGAGGNFTTGLYLTIIGQESAAQLTTSNNITTLGNNTISRVTSGNNNIMIGEFAGNTHAGGQFTTSISNSIFIGHGTRSATASGDVNAIVIGDGIASEGPNTTLIGTASTVSTHLYGELRVGTINNAVGDFVTTSATGVLQKRTAAQVVSDLGISPISGLTTNRIPKATSATGIGDSRLIDDGNSAYFENQGTSTYFGFQAGNSDIGNRNNVFFGRQAGFAHTGTDGVGIGEAAGGSNTTGSRWTAVGRRAGYVTGTGSFWTAVGYDAGANTSNASSWTAVGYEAGRNSPGGGFTAIGYGAAKFHTVGSNYVVVGMNGALKYANNAGASDFTNGIYIGYGTKVSASGATNEIVIGYDAFGDGSNTTVIGNSSTTDTHLYGQLRVDTINNLGVTATNFLVADATSVIHNRTNTELLADLTNSLPGYNGAVAQYLTHDATGAFVWVNL